MEEKELNLDGYLRQAVSIGRAFGDADLDYSVESLEGLDNTVREICIVYGKNRIDKRKVWYYSVSLGVYFGEVMLRDSLKSRGFSWKEHDGIPMLADDIGNIISPIFKIYRIFLSVKGEPEEDSELTGYYKKLLGMLDGTVA